MDLMMLVPTSNDRLNAQQNLEFPSTKHECKIPVQWDELKNVIEGNGIYVRARRWFRRKCLVSKKHPDTRYRLRSRAAISYEYTRQITSYIYMIHPFSEFRIYWESMMIVATMLALLIIPYRISFFFEVPYGEWFLITAMLNVTFLIDILLWFFTGFYELDTNVVVLEPRLVARKYILGWFLIDLLSALPIELFAVLKNSTPNGKQLYSYFQVLKIFRLRIIGVYGRRLRRVYGMTFQKHKALELTILMVVVLHWAACAEYYVSSTVRRAMIQAGKTHDNWINLSYVKNRPVAIKYIIALYRAVAAMVGCLKYDVLAAIEDIVLDIILSIFGRIANIYLIAQWLQLMKTYRGANNSYLRLAPQLREYIRHKELPIEIQNRLTTYYGYCTQRSIDLEKQIMDQVSVQLREELMLHRSRKLVERVTFFKRLPEAVVSRIATSLRSEVFLPNDIIIKAGTTGNTMYFIASGTVAIYTSLGKEVMAVCHLKDGAHFGEISLIMENEQRLASVVAVEICELYVLTREDFKQAIDRHPHLMNSLQKLVLERLEKTLFLGELYRLEGNIPELFNKLHPKSGQKQNNKNWNYLYTLTHFSKIHLWRRYFQCMTTILPYFFIFLFFFIAIIFLWDRGKLVYSF